MRVSGYQFRTGWAPSTNLGTNRGCITVQKLFEQIVDMVQGL